MIVSTTPLSPSQKSCVEQQAGREQQAIVLSGSQKIATAAEREQAVHQMRSRLALLDASQRRLSIADSMAALLGDTGTELPA